MAAVTAQAPVVRVTFSINSNKDRRRPPTLRGILDTAASYRRRLQGFKGISRPWGMRCTVMHPRFSRHVAFRQNVSIIAMRWPCDRAAARAFHQHRQSVGWSAVRPRSSIGVPRRMRSGMTNWSLRVRGDASASSRAVDAGAIARPTPNGAGSILVANPGLGRSRPHCVPIAWQP
jgi:hypothetical protein